MSAPHLGKMLSVFLGASSALLGMASAQTGPRNGPPSDAAGVLDLLCTASNGETAELFLDSNKMQVRYTDKEYRDGKIVTQTDSSFLANFAGASTAPHKVRQYVTITDSEIAFGDDQHSHKLDRYSGILYIRYYKLAFAPIHCVPRIKKF
jgi:hypothetical protein